MNKRFGTPYDVSENRAGILDVLIATKLSQNTTDKSSFVAFTNLKKKFRNWDEVSQADVRLIKMKLKSADLRIQNQKKFYLF
ncbi:MAG: hypothetical protein IPM96_13685 [Ignavibacteria bacterium]|nr:hypothetical protein [Ignavibacteria bacterium]